MIQVLHLLKLRGDKGLGMLLMVVVSGYIIWFTYSVTDVSISKSPSKNTNDTLHDLPATT
jgi:hypothetical protein